MPERKLWTRHVGMEALNSVGSTGSCDSIESISSNHSTFSGEGYDHLSAEERECLMFLEETIESLDNEEDSGLSNDEVEANNRDSLLASEPAKIQFSANNEKISPKVATLPKREEWTNTANNLNTVSQGHHSFPRVQVSKPSPKQPFESKMGGPPKDQQKLSPEKPKRMSTINQQHTGESLVSESLILPPPEAFRDPQIVDKRHSVTDPTDTREVWFDRIVLKPAAISEHQEALVTLKQSNQTLPPPVYPRVSSPNKFLTGEQENLSQAIEKPSETHFKQGPPTAPKPRTLPPHIVIKTSRGDIQNLDPQKRPRTFSAHERSTANESVMTNVLHSKEQERARQEALQKLGLEKKSSSRENVSVPPFKTDHPAAPGGNKQENKEDKNKTVVTNQQEEKKSSKSVPVQPLVAKNEAFAKNRLSMKSNLFEKAEQPVNSTHGPITNDITVNTKHSEKTNIQEKPNELTTLSLNVHEVTDNSKNVKSESHENASQRNPVPQRKEHFTDKPDHSFREACFNSDTFLIPGQDSSKNPVKLQTSTAPIQASIVPEKNLVPDKTAEHFKRVDRFQRSLAQENKTASLENINMISTSPRNRFSFSPPKEPLDTQHSAKVTHNDGKGRPPVDKSNRHSTHFEPSDEPYLRLPQGLVPGLRQISIKSNTLERSGVGLSSSLPSIEKGGNSFFKKPIFSGNFLRNNRPRPASLGTGKDFANLEPSTAAAESTEKHSFFSKPSRQSAPVTSVKIAPKGSTDEHRRQALKKLGILKE
ncbi:specifically androgen-regulated gene protein [Rana temporaria]|uniref:specifically androgen-regulated gene protein n=1 Tax=Rana temporaria TaxID=8407 RepID=UPI001AAC5394|nr:specifically androgen-regulated gene protein [Rana temporaria]